VLRFDQRGTGLSDREVALFSFEAHARDLEAVVDAAGWKRFALLGLSQGAASAITYAAAHPERASHLVICGGFRARLGEARQPAGADGAARDASPADQVRLGPRRSSFRQVFRASQFMPDAPIEAIRSFNDFMPLTASARVDGTIFSTNSQIDVQERARRVEVPDPRAARARRHAYSVRRGQAPPRA